MMGGDTRYISTLDRAVSMQLMAERRSCDEGSVYLPCASACLKTRDGIPASLAAN
jgi:hypothetical protein